MRIHSKAALGILALAIVCSPAIARAPQEGPSPDQSQGPDESGSGDPMRHMGPHGLPGRWSERDGRWGRGGRMGMRGRGFGPREFRLARLLSDPNIRQQLGVTAEQAAKIRQQESDFRKAEIRNRADMEIKRMDLDDLLSADKPDRAAIDSKLQEISAAQLALEKSAVDHRLTMRDALTPAQRQKLHELMTQRRHPAPSTKVGARGPRGGGRGERGTAPPPKAQGQGQTPNP